MLVGFIHGVMNTDNMAISGETIDYGPCAFMDAFDPDTVFSSIDHGGRYAYGNQPHIAQWNLARLAETLLPLIEGDTSVAVERATAVLNTFGDRYRDACARACAPSSAWAPRPARCAGDLLALLRGRRLHDVLPRAGRVPAPRRRPARALFDDPSAYDGWRERWLAAEPDPDAMDRVNPLYIPRNHLVEDALTAATAGDLEPLQRLLGGDHEALRPAPRPRGLRRAGAAGFGPYQTFCGT